MAALGRLIQKLGSAVKKVADKKGSSWWYTPHMAAASQAIAERIPLVDLVLEVRDARIPWSSKYEQLKHLPPSSRHIIVLNKMDLANHSHMKEWLMYFEEWSCIAVGVNSHNKENMKEFLNFLQARVRELKKNGHSSHTTTIMLVGVPNVGKSALANSLHQIGRISAAGVCCWNENGISSMEIIIYYGFRIAPALQMLRKFFASPKVFAVAPANSDDGTKMGSLLKVLNEEYEIVFSNPVEVVGAATLAQKAKEIGIREYWPTIAAAASKFKGQLTLATKQ